MTLDAQAHLTIEAVSEKAGRELATSLLDRLVGPPLAMVSYCTLLHDQAELLAGMAQVTGGKLPLIGCSTQGLFVNGEVVEGGYAAGAMLLGGHTTQVGTAMVSAIGERSEHKGTELAQALIDKMGGHPDVVVLLYDPISGVDVTAMLAGIADCTAAPVIGAAAGAPWGPLVTTYQYHGAQVLEKSAVALGLRGSFEVLTGRSGGAAPTGTAMTITRAEGNRILELDHLPALHVWSELLTSESSDIGSGSAAWSLGLRSDRSDDGQWIVMAASSFDEAAGAIVLQATVKEGATVMLHQRSTEIIVGDVRRLAKRMREQLAGRAPLAVLGFECGARTGPFLGKAATQKENELLRNELAPASQWLGMMAWGEITPVGKTSSFCNYTYPVLALAPEGLPRG